MYTYIVDGTNAGDVSQHVYMCVHICTLHIDSSMYIYIYVDGTHAGDVDIYIYICIRMYSHIFIHSYTHV